MKTSRAGIDLIKEFEGLRLEAYLCPADVWTIGYGHTSAAGEPLVTRGMKITAAEAERILARDLIKYESAVDRLVKVEIAQHQFDVLVSFAYNCGVGALAKSTLLKRLNAGRADAVPAELMKWTKSGGRELPGLVRRRRAEAQLWRGLDETQAAPIDEARAAPDAPRPSKTMMQSREGNAALVAGGLSAVTLAKEIADGAQTASDAITTILGLEPIMIVLAVVCIAAAAIWVWRKQRLEEEGA